MSQRLKNKKVKINKPFKSETINYEFSTRDEKWKQAITEAITDLDISIPTMKKIKKDLRRNFFKFVIHDTSKEHMTYEDWLLKRNPKLQYVPSKDMCQNIDISVGIKEKIKGVKKSKKAIHYEIAGSGIPGNFCISGEKTLASMGRPIFSDNVPKQKKYYKFKLNLNYSIKGN